MALTITVDRVGDVLRAIRKLTENRCLVGIPEDQAQRTAGQISNAALGYIHENGSPAQNIPARPFLVPGVERAQDKTVDYLTQGAKLALEGNAPAMDRALSAAGQNAVSSVKSRIAEGIPPPLKPRTVAARVRRRRGRPGAAQTTPLIDTGQLLNSITYVIRKAK